jgi:5-(carboxyamino)imidazole ribonucleotide mutase
MLKVAVLMGSKSDKPVMDKATEELAARGIEFEELVLSAHRNPDEVAEFSKNAAANGFGVIIAGAGMSAALAGTIAARTELPVIGVPIVSGGLGGLDALLSTVQMPPGVPVATMAINGAKNAAIYASKILNLA